MTELRKISVEEQKQLITDEEIKKAFLVRKDIAPLPPEEQERRWQQHLARVNEFREFLSKHGAVLITETKGATTSKEFIMCPDDAIGWQSIVCVVQSPCPHCGQMTNLVRFNKPPSNKIILPCGCVFRTLVLEPAPDNAWGVQIASGELHEDFVDTPTIIVEQAQ